MVILSYVDDYWLDDGSEIKISGQYLREFGFEPSSKVVIDVTDKQIIIKPVDMEDWYLLEGLYLQVFHRYF